MNSYILLEDGTYMKTIPTSEPPFDIHKEFFKVNRSIVQKARLFPEIIEEKPKKSKKKSDITLKA
jgi:hypothetical protein